MRASLATSEGEDLAHSLGSSDIHPPKDVCSFRVYSPNVVEGEFCELRQYGVLGSLAGRKSYSVLAPVASKMLAGPGAALNIGPTGAAPTGLPGKRSRSRPLSTNVVGELRRINVHAFSSAHSNCRCHPTGAIEPL